MRVLILYTSVGLGHKTMAENIGARLSASGFEVRLEDILKVQAGRLVSVSTAIHQFINRYLPFVWKWLYFGTNTWLSDLTLPLRIKLAGRNCDNTKKVIEEFQPDVVIATQTTASAVIAYLKDRGFYRGSFGIAFSDFHLHRFWLYPQADFYLTNITEQKEQMEVLGVKSRIFVCGMTTKPKPEVDREAVRTKFDIKPGQSVALVGIGSLGIGLHLDMLDQVTSLGSVKVFIVCGKNEMLYKELSEKYKGRDNVVVLGFYTPMAELYAVAGIFITKPGGLSTTESLQWQLPALVTHMLPGQEELNIDYLVRNRLIMFEPFTVARVEQELHNHVFRQQLAHNQAVDAILNAPGLREASEWLLHKADRRAPESEPVRAD